MASAQSEPSMDEILASIRRIISEEGEAAPTEANGAKAAPLKLDDTSALKELADDDALGDESDEAAAQEAVAEDASAEAEPEGEAAAPEADTESEQKVHAFPSADPLDDFGDSEPEAGTSEDQPQAEAASPGPNSEAIAAVTKAVEPLVSQSVAGKAANAFSSLERNMRVAGGSSRTIEDLVEAMLAPMIKSWLDEHLSRIVEDKVEEEVRRIARRR